MEKGIMEHEYDQVEYEWGKDVAGILCGEDAGKYICHARRLAHDIKRFFDGFEGGSSGNELADQILKDSVFYSIEEMEMIERKTGKAREERISDAAMMGSIWSDAVVADAENVRDLPKTYQDFLQMVANANCPVFPSFHTEEETDTAYDTAWERYCRLTEKEEE
jgi:hypothetical protein